MVCQHSKPWARVRGAKRLVQIRILSGKFHFKQKCDSGMMFDYFATTGRMQPDTHTVHSADDSTKNFSHRFSMITACHTQICSHTTFFHDAITALPL